MGILAEDDTEGIEAGLAHRPRKSREEIDCNTMARISAIARGLPVRLLEKHVAQQVRDFLSYRGWRPVRMTQTVLPGSFRTGEPGQADYLFLHYLTGSK